MRRFLLFYPFNPACMRFISSRFVGERGQWLGWPGLQIQWKWALHLRHSTSTPWKLEPDISIWYYSDFLRFVVILGSVPLTLLLRSRRSFTIVSDRGFGFAALCCLRYNRTLLAFWWLQPCVAFGFAHCKFELNFRITGWNSNERNDSERL